MSLGEYKDDETGKYYRIISGEKGVYKAEEIEPEIDKCGMPIMVTKIVSLEYINHQSYRKWVF